MIFFRRLLDDEDNALCFDGCDFDEAMGEFIYIGKTVFMRNTKQGAIEPIRPAMIGAHEGAHTAFARHEFCPAVTARIFKGTHFTVSPAHNNERDSGSALCNVIARFR